MKRLIFISILVVLSANVAVAQKATTKNQTKEGHEIIFNIKNAPDKMVSLAINYKESWILKDSTQASAPGKFVFKGKNNYDDGLYTLISEKKYPYLTFIVDKGQFFEFKIDTSGIAKNFTVLNSEPNLTMLQFQQKNNDAQQLAKTWSDKLQSFNGEKDKDSVEFYRNKLIDLNKEMIAYIDEVINAHPDYLFSKMQRAYKQIEIPDAPAKYADDKEEGLEWQRWYYRTHYWDNVDLGDGRLIFTPAFEPKIKDYFDKILKYMEVDSIIIYTDMLIAKSTDSLMYRYVIDWTCKLFQEDGIMGHDGVFVHIVKNNQLQGKCKWMDEDLLNRYKKRIDRIEPILIGKVAPELIMPDTNLIYDAAHTYSTYQTKKPYTVLWFYDPKCHTCKAESIKLAHLYDSLENAGTRNFEVYAVAGSCTDAEWKSYVKEHNYKWIQVGGNQGNINYIDYFDVIGNPSMFIFDKDHKIILNRRIDTAIVGEYIDQWERIQKNLKDRAAKNR